MNADHEITPPLTPRHGPAMNRAEAVYLNGLRTGRRMAPHLTLEALLVAFCADKPMSREYMATQMWLLFRGELNKNRDLVSIKVWRAFHRRHRFTMRYSGHANLVAMSNQFDAEIASKAARAAIDEMMEKHSRTP